VSALYELQGVCMRYGAAEILRGVTLDLSPGSLVTLAGPNGAGKSTLLGILAALRPGFSGTCRFGGRDVRQWTRRALARDVAFVPQSLKVEFPFTAEQVVLMGRTPYCDGLFESDADWREVDRALSLTDAVAFRKRDFRTLSGGEKQRVILAAALAQTPRVLLLDEPTTWLDLRHQIALYQLLRRLCGEGMLVVAVTHDLNLAAAYSDRVILLDGGAVAADAVPGEALSAERIQSVFGVTARVAEADGRQWILYAG
jgi:iron complex transport system ATP-binding protein